MEIASIAGTWKMSLTSTCRNRVKKWQFGATMLLCGSLLTACTPQGSLPGTSSTSSDSSAENGWSGPRSHPGTALEPPLLTEVPAGGSKSDAKNPLQGSTEPSPEPKLDSEVNVELGPSGPPLAEPTLAQPTLAEPTLAQPTLAQPTLAEPTLGDPANGQSLSADLSLSSASPNDFRLAGSRADKLTLDRAGPTPAESASTKMGSPTLAEPDSSEEDASGSGSNGPNKIALKPETPTVADGGGDSPPGPKNTLRSGTSETKSAFDRSDADGIKAASPVAPLDYTQWETPQVTLVFTGQQHGYIEPCGCTGLDRQKGGVARRFTFLQGLRDKGWELLPVDTGNLIRRFDSQGTIKFHRSMEALREMDYVAVGFGPDDVRLSVDDLIQEAAVEAVEDPIYASANVVLIDPELELMPRIRVVEGGGLKVGLTSVLDPDMVDGSTSSDIQILPAKEATQKALNLINQESPDFRVLTYFGAEEAGQELVRQIKGFDLLVVSGGYGEPTFQPVAIEGSETKMIVTGNKGMYAGLVGIQAKPKLSFRYARVALSHEFQDAPEMRRLMKEYQDQLRDLGLEGLGLKPIPHPKGGKYVGSAECGTCHTTAFEIWESSEHFNATADIVRPPVERGDIARHFDPECLSCHVTGWNPQNYFPYATGFLSLDDSPLLQGNGCENCHGPGAAHSNAEKADSGISAAEKEKLREAIRLPLSGAREKCMECHDLDNSPDFHDEDAFEDVYWPEIEHYGLD